jgi:hypothetical protein
LILDKILLAADTFSGALRRILTSRATHVGVAAWLLLNAAAWWLAQGYIPFDMPAVRHLPFLSRMLSPTIGLIEVFALMALTWWLTRRRTIPDLAARAPDRMRAARETVWLIAYAVVGQIGGWVLGPMLGYRAFSFHLAGTLYGCSVPPSLGEMWTWMAYNFVVFALVPFVWFRQRYSAQQLSLRSADKRGDLRLIMVVLAVEGLFELAGINADFFALSAQQMLIGGAITVFFYVLGTVLPTMVLIYAILLPRYLRLTGSPVATVLLCGVTYAALHLVEGWSLFTSWRLGTLSVVFVFLQYLGPGMIKAVLTMRTGNAWVHAWGYHTVAPHLLIDTPIFVKALGIR